MFFLKLTLFVIYTQGLFERLLGSESGIYFVEVPFCLFLIINYNFYNETKVLRFFFFNLSVLVLMTFTFQIVDGIKYMRFVVYFYFFTEYLQCSVQSKSLPTYR